MSIVQNVGQLVAVIFVPGNFCRCPFFPGLANQVAIVNERIFLGIKANQVAGVAVGIGNDFIQDNRRRQLFPMPDVGLYLRR